jgi:hypothetical protein
MKNEKICASSYADSLFAYTLSQTELRKSIVEQLTPDSIKAKQVIWQDGESEIVFYLNKLRLAIKNGYVILDTQLETDQTGISHLVVPFRLGNSAKQATLTVTTESVPRGNLSLAARWGQIVQEQLWFALLNSGENILAKETESSSLQLSGLYCEGESIVYVFSSPATIDEIQEYIDAAMKVGFEHGHDNFDPTVIDLGSSEDSAQPDEAGLFGQLLRELYRLFLQFFRFIRKFWELIIFIFQKIMKFIQR